MGYVKDREIASRQRLALAKLLCVDKDRTGISYSDDSVGTLVKAVSNTDYVPDNWDAWDRLAPILYARWANFQAARFKSEPALAGYEAAAQLREAARDFGA